MICKPCRPVHTPADCIDTLAGRESARRHCVCQHHPRLPQVSAPTPPEGDQDVEAMVSDE